MIRSQYIDDAHGSDLSNATATLEKRKELANSIRDASVNVCGILICLIIKLTHVRIASIRLDFSIVRFAHSFRATAC
jgi:hypothetical protein